MTRSRRFTNGFAVCVTASFGGLAVSVVGLALDLHGWWIGGGAVAGAASMTGFCMLGRALEAAYNERRRSS